MQIEQKIAITRVWNIQETVEYKEKDKVKNKKANQVNR